MTKASDNAFPSILITEATEPSAPAAGKQRLYIDSTTHLLKATNSSGTDRTIEGVAAGAITGSGLTMATARLLGRTTASTGAVEEITVGTGLTLSAGTLSATAAAGAYSIITYTAGDITISSTSAGADFPSVGDATVAAATGDLLLVGFNVRVTTANTSSCRIDVKFITGATENYVSNGTTTPATTGISGFFFAASHTMSVSGVVPYVVQAADISGGNVVCSLRAWLSGAQNWVMAAATGAPLQFWVKNLKQ